MGGADSQPWMPILLPTNPPLADQVRVLTLANRSQVFYHRLYHQYAELVPQALWEHAHYHNLREHFERRLSERSTLRLGTYSCDQREAAIDRVMADTVVVSWIAQRWRRGGHDRLDTFVNLGAKDGLSEDPLQHLLQDIDAVSFALAVEMNEESCAKHRANLPHVNLLCTKISTANVEGIVDHLPVSMRRGRDGRVGSHVDQPVLDVLKVDLDAADCDVMEVFLARAPAKFVVTEVYDGFPPPIRFALHDSDLLTWPPDPPWGCSLSYQVHLLTRFGHELVWYGAGNALFAHASSKSRVGLRGPLDELDCYAKSVVMSMWPDGRTLRRWFYEEPLDSALHEVRTKLKKRLRGVPFTVSL